MQDFDYHTLPSKNRAFEDKPEKTTRKLPEGVGEEWPRLLSKKWMAIHYDCWNGKEVLWRRFRSHVLTEDVLKRAGIDPAFAYSRHCKTFNAIDSLMLTKVLRGFCLLLLLFACKFTQAQTNSNANLFGRDAQSLAHTIPTEYTRDTFISDTIPGQVMLTDSIVRMVEAGHAGEYRFEKVLSSIVVDAYLVKQYRYLVRGYDGGTDPFEVSQSFHLLTGGLIDPKRVLIFKTKSK